MPELRLPCFIPRRSRQRTLLMVMLLAAVTVTSCGGPRLIQGRPPFVGISGMRLVDNDLETDFRVANQNEVIMTLQSIALDVSVDSGVLVSEKRELALEIGASSSEELHVATMLDTGMRNLLTALESQAVNSVAFELKGNVRTVEDGVLRFEQKGHLYPVPGKPGYFRSAVTQAEKLQREDRY